MWHAPRGWWPVCTGKWRSPSPLTLRTPTVTTMSLLLPTCLQWRPPTQWCKVSPHTHTPPPPLKSTPRPRAQPSLRSELPSPRGLSHPWSIPQLAVSVKGPQQTNSRERSLVENDLIGFRRMSVQDHPDIWKRMQANLKTAAVIPTCPLPTSACSVTSLTHTVPLKGCLFSWAQLFFFFWSHSYSLSQTFVCWVGCPEIRALRQSLAKSGLSEVPPHPHDYCCCSTWHTVQGKRRGWQEKESCGLIFLLIKIQCQWVRPLSEDKSVLSVDK